MTDTFQLTIFEKILIFSGLLFLANVIYLATGGNFTLLFIAKGVYLLGIVWLAAELLTNE